MVWTEIGTATTNSNGVASLPITGTGAGKVKYKASSSDGRIQSEIYELCDTIWYDNAVLGDKNTNWSKSDALTVTVDNEGTLLSGSTSNTTYALNNGNTSYTTWVLEFDVISVSGYTAINFSSSSTMVLYNQITDNCHVKLVNDGSTLELFVDGVSKSTVSHSVTNGYIRFLIGNSGSVSLKYKSLQLYNY